jgi:hypothetical protein
LAISQEGKENFLSVGEKLKKFQMLEFSYLIDQSLNFISNTHFLQKTNPDPSHNPSHNPSHSQSHNHSQSQQLERPSMREHDKSLGIESNFRKDSQEEELDLMCTEDITLPLPLPM